MKNKKFKVRYILTLSGISTNNSSEKLLERHIKTIESIWNIRFNQTKLEVEKEEL